jgi:hypothetical protein
MVKQYDLKLLRTQDEFAKLIGRKPQTINIRIKKFQRANSFSENEVLTKGMLKPCTIAGRDLIYLPDVEIMPLKSVCELIAKGVKKDCHFDENKTIEYTFDERPFGQINLYCDLIFKIEWYNEHWVCTILNIENCGLYDHINDIQIKMFDMAKFEIELENRINYEVN